MASRPRARKGRLIRSRRTAQLVCSPASRAEGRLSAIVAPPKGYPQAPAPEDIASEDIVSDDHAPENIAPELMTPESVALAVVAAESMPADAAAEMPPSPPAHGKPHRSPETTITRTAGGAAMVAVGMFVSGVLGYVQTLGMTHMVARSTYGTFVVVFTVVTFVGSLTRLGLDGALLRFLARYRGQGNRSAAVGLVQISLAGSFGISLLCGFGLFIFAPFIADTAFHSATYAVPLREGAVLIPLSSMQGMVLNGLLALQAIKWQVYVGKIIEPVATPALMLIFFLLGWRLEALIYGYVFGIGLSLVVGWVVFGRKLERVVHGAPPTYAPRMWVRFGTAMLFGTMTNSLVQSTDVLGVSAFSTAAQVALYRVADRVSSLISLPIFALSSIFAPTIAELHARKDHEHLARMYAVVTRWMFMLSLPIFLCCVIFPQPILDVFGPSYAAGVTALLVLAVGNVINAATGPAGNMVAMTSRARVLWLNTALRLLTNVALIVLLVPHWAVLGAAIASSLTMVVSNTVALVEVWLILRIQPYRWEILKPVLAGGVATLVGEILLRTSHSAARAGLHSGLHAFVYALVLVLIFTAVYGLTVVALGLSQDDREVLAAARARFSGRRRTKTANAVA